VRLWGTVWGAQCLGLSERFFILKVLKGRRHLSVTSHEPVDALLRLRFTRVNDLPRVAAASSPRPVMVSPAPKLLRYIYRAVLVCP